MKGIVLSYACTVFMQAMLIAGGLRNLFYGKDEIQILCVVPTSK